MSGSVILKHNFTAGCGDGESGVIQISESGFGADSYTLQSSYTVENHVDEEMVLVLEELEWDQDALTARELTSLQLFRDLFATEVLSPDQEIQVSRMTILFTDLKGSTSSMNK